SNKSSSSSSSSSSTGAAGGGGKGGKIAFLLPENQTARYESLDRPLFEKYIRQFCSSCQILYSNAPKDASKQQSHAEAAIAQGAHSVIDKSGYKIAKEFDTPGWTPAKAQTEMEQSITALGKNGFVGVYAANDGTAGVAIAAMKGSGIDPTKIPSTGQDSEIA